MSLGTATTSSHPAANIVIERETFAKKGHILHTVKSKHFYFFPRLHHGCLRWHTGSWFTHCLITVPTIQWGANTGDRNAGRDQNPWEISYFEHNVCATISISSLTSNSVCLCIFLLGNHQQPFVWLCSSSQPTTHSLPHIYISLHYFLSCPPTRWNNVLSVPPADQPSSSHPWRLTHIIWTHLESVYSHLLIKLLLGGDIIVHWPLFNVCSNNGGQRALAALCKKKKHHLLLFFSVAGDQEK